MRTIRTIPFLLVLAVAAVPPSSIASGTTDQARSQNSWMDSWMPDVAERAAALRERTARAGVEARVRSRSEQARNGQWWRAVAAVPARDWPR